MLTVHSSGDAVLLKAMFSCKMFGFNITHEAIMSQCWELDKNTFITCNVYNMNKKTSSILK